MKADLSSSNFSACIHRGANQIGGSCVELAYDGAHLLLDLGKPLDVDEADERLLPPVAGLVSGADASLVGIVISHGHIDHWGLLPLVKGDVRIAMGPATRRILQAAKPFVLSSFSPDQTIDLADEAAINLGPFTIEPRLVDHSAFDAYALTVQAGNRRVFYSGDLRGHGRKAPLFRRLLRSPPRAIDTMFMEGTTLGRVDSDKGFPTESEIERRFVDRFRQSGFIAVFASAQNIDRIVSLYRACLRTGRTLLLDLYAMEVLRATGNTRMPHPGSPNLAVYIPEYQRRQIARKKLFDVLKPYKEARIFLEHLADVGSNAAMLFRPAMIPDIDAVGLWTGAQAIWSQWEGYLNEERCEKLKADLANREVALEVIHTSGHASVADLQRLARAINPKILVPIHTFEGHRFSEFFENVVSRKDGEWWSV